MRIEINETWLIETEALNFILRRKRLVGGWKTEGYYPTLEYLFRGLVFHEALAADCRELRDLTAVVNKLGHEIEKIGPRLDLCRNVMSGTAKGD